MHGTVLAPAVHLRVRVLLFSFDGWTLTLILPVFGSRRIWAGMYFDGISDVAAFTARFSVALTDLRLFAITSCFLSR